MWKSVCHQVVYKQEYFTAALLLHSNIQGASSYFFSLFAALLAHAEFSQWVKRLKHEVTCCKVAVRRAMCHVVYNDHSLSKVKTFGRFKEIFWQGCCWASMVHGLSDKPNIVVPDLHQGFFHTHTESNFRHCSHHSKSHKRGCFLWLLLKLGCRLKSLK